MVDLAMRESPNTSYDQAKRVIKSFQTIVYLEDFKVKEITRIVGYDEKKKDMIYQRIYKREES
jgi:ERCC4-type nuclease